jgi:hypothetical protein
MPQRVETGCPGPAGPGHNVAAILQDNALRLMLERYLPAIEVGNREDIASHS